MYSLRKLTFGKYKGEYILYIISTHIGYIMWCLENLSWFKLTDIDLNGVNHSFEKDAQIALEKAESEEDVFGGLEGPYCYTGL